MSQADALRATVGGMELGSEHQALVALCEGLAEQLDDRPTAALWREYLQAVVFLLSRGESEADDGQAALLELVRTPVGDKSKPGSSDDGSGDSRGGGESGAAVDAVAAAGGRRRRRTSP